MNIAEKILSYRSSLPGGKKKNKKSSASPKMIAQAQPIEVTYNYNIMTDSSANRPVLQTANHYRSSSNHSNANKSPRQHSQSSFQPAQPIHIQHNQQSRVLSPRASNIKQYQYKQQPNYSNVQNHRPSTPQHHQHNRSQSNHRMNMQHNQHQHNQHHHHHPPIQPQKHQPLNNPNMSPIPIKQSYSPPTYPPNQVYPPNKARVSFNTNVNQNGHQNHHHHHHHHQHQHQHDQNQPQRGYQPNLNKSRKRSQFNTMPQPHPHSNASPVHKPLASPQARLSGVGQQLPPNPPNALAQWVPRGHSNPQQTNHRSHNQLNHNMHPQRLSRSASPRHVKSGSVSSTHDHVPLPALNKSRDSNKVKKRPSNSRQPQIPVMQQQTSVEELPLGWAKLRDDRGFYYFNVITAEKQRDRPTQDATQNIPANKPLPLRKSMPNKPLPNPYAHDVAPSVKCDDMSVAEIEYRRQNGSVVFAEIMKAPHHLSSNQLIHQENWDMLIDAIYLNLSESDFAQVFRALRSIAENLFDEDDKYRILYADNKKVQQRILSRIGGYEFLRGLGFREVTKRKLVCEEPDFDIVATAITAINAKLSQIDREKAQQLPIIPDSKNVNQAQQYHDDQSLAPYLQQNELDRIVAMNKQRNSMKMKEKPPAAAKVNYRDMDDDEKEEKGSELIDTEQAHNGEPKKAASPVPAKLSGPGSPQSRERGASKVTSAYYSDEEDDGKVEQPIEEAKETDAGPQETQEYLEQLRRNKEASMNQQVELEEAESHKHVSPKMVEEHYDDDLQGRIIHHSDEFEEEEKDYKAPEEDDDGLAPIPETRKRSLSFSGGQEQAQNHVHAHSKHPSELPYHRYFRSVHGSVDEQSFDRINAQDISHHRHRSSQERRKKSSTSRRSGRGRKKAHTQESILNVRSSSRDSKLRKKISMNAADDDEIQEEVDNAYIDTEKKLSVQDLQEEEDVESLFDDDDEMPNNSNMPNAGNFGRYNIPSRQQATQHQQQQTITDSVKPHDDFFVNHSRRNSHRSNAQESVDDTYIYLTKHQHGSPPKKAQMHHNNGALAQRGVNNNAPNSHIDPRLVPDLQPIHIQNIYMRSSPNFNKPLKKKSTDNRNSAIYQPRSQQQHYKSHQQEDSGKFHGDISDHFNQNYRNSNNSNFQNQQQLPMQQAVPQKRNTEVMKKPMNPLSPKLSRNQRQNRSNSIDNMLMVKPMGLLLPSEQAKQRKKNQKKMRKSMGKQIGAFFHSIKTKKSPKYTQDDFAEMQKHKAEYRQNNPNDDYYDFYGDPTDDHAQTVRVLSPQNSNSVNTASHNQSIRTAPNIIHPKMHQNPIAQKAQSSYSGSSRQNSPNIKPHPVPPNINQLRPIEVFFEDGQRVTLQVDANITSLNLISKGLQKRGWSPTMAMHYKLVLAEDQSREFVEVDNNLHPITVLPTYVQNFGLKNPKFVICYKQI